MGSVSSILSNAGQMRPAVSHAQELSKINQTLSSDQVFSREPAQDRFIPEKKEEPIGLYRLGKDADGNPQIYFDDPDLKQPDKASKEDDPNGPKVSAPKQESQKEKSWTCNTDAVDREIEKLKRKQQDLSQQLQSETDETKRNRLEKNLAQIERELSQKDNDAYRKQHAVYTMA